MDIITVFPVIKKERWLDIITVLPQKISRIHPVSWLIISTQAGNWTGKRIETDNQPHQRSQTAWHDLWFVMLKVEVCQHWLLIFQSMGSYCHISCIEMSDGWAAPYTSDMIHTFVHVHKIQKKQSKYKRRNDKSPQKESCHHRQCQNKLYVGVWWERERERDQQSFIWPCCNSVAVPKETQKNKTLMEILEKEMESRVAVKASCCT